MASVPGTRKPLTAQSVQRELDGPVQVTLETQWSMRGHSTHSSASLDVAALRT